MKDGYEAEENDFIINEKSNTSSGITPDEIYTILGCEVLDEK